LRRTAIRNRGLIPLSGGRRKRGYADDARAFCAEDNFVRTGNRLRTGRTSHVIERNDLPRGGSGESSSPDLSGLGYHACGRFELRYSEIPDPV